MLRLLLLPPELAGGLESKDIRNETAALTMEVSAQIVLWMPSLMMLLPELHRQVL